MGTMKTNYLHLSNHDHLLNLVEIYSDALRRKEDKIDELCLQLSMAHSPLNKAEKPIAGPSVIHKHDVRTLEIKNIIEGIEEIYKKEMTQQDFSTFPDDFSLQFGEEHVGYSFPAPSSWVLSPIALIDSCPALLIRIISGCTLRAAAMVMERSDWDCHFGVRGLGNDEFLPSLGSNDSFCLILDLVYWLHGAVMIYTSLLSGLGICFYAPWLGVICICRRPLWVEWTVDDSDTTNLVTGSDILGGLNGSHVDIVDGVDLFALSCEPPFVVASIEGISHGYSDISLGQTGVFHLDCILRCVHQFTFSSHTQVLTMSLTAGKGELSMEHMGQHWYDIFPITGGESEFGKSLTLFIPVSCLQKQVSETWFDCTVEGDRVVQRQHGGFILGDGVLECGRIVVVTPYFNIYRRPLQLLQTVVEDFFGIAQLPSIYTCGSIRHYSRRMMSAYMPLDGDWLIAMSWVGWCSRVSFRDTRRLGDGTDWHHFWDILLRDADGYPLRWSSFHFLLLRIELGNRVLDMDHTEAPSQDILHGIDLSSLKFFSVGFD
ncbi:hypothetical protein SUGI_0685280 [Cryptomeria japonica]|nr:hypothetical protein SUGI_0685280 [Cryptomeria japonica]